MNKIMSLIPDNFKDIEKDYIEAKELLKDPAWQIMYWERKKHYYENNYSHGTKTEEYKEVLKQLRKLKNN